jgi:hypothetical protein
LRSGRTVEWRTATSIERRTRRTGRPVGAGVLAPIEGRPCSPVEGRPGTAITRRPAIEPARSTAPERCRTALLGSEPETAARARART